MIVEAEAKESLKNAMDKIQRDKRLADAAPDLLRALKSLLIWMDHGYNPFTLPIREVRAAIEKAEGKSTLEALIAKLEGSK
jgi:hypothetical protein